MLFNERVAKLGMERVIQVHYNERSFRVGESVGFLFKIGITSREFLCKPRVLESHNSSLIPLNVCDVGHFNLNYGRISATENATPGRLAHRNVS